MHNSDYHGDLLSIFSYIIIIIIILYRFVAPPHPLRLHPSFSRWSL
jgi:hypothetical protein